MFHAPRVGARYVCFARRTQRRRASISTLQDKSRVTPGKECLPRKEIAFTLSDSPDVCVLWCEIIFHVDDFRRARWVDSWFVFRVNNSSFQNPDSCRLKVWVTTCTWHREFRFMRGHRSIASRLTGCFIVDGIECASIFEERLIITHNFIPMETGSA